MRNGRRFLAVTLAVLVAVAAFVAWQPQIFFKVNAESVGSSIDDELEYETIYECLQRNPKRFECSVGSPGSGASGPPVRIEVDDARCWKSIPDHKDRNPHLSGCIGLFDYLFEGGDSFSE